MSNMRQGMIVLMRLAPALRVSNYMIDPWVFFVLLQECPLGVRKLRIIVDPNAEYLNVEKRFAVVLKLFDCVRPDWKSHDLLGFEQRGLFPVIGIRSPPDHLSWPTVIIRRNY